MRTRRTAVAAVALPLVLAACSSTEASTASSAAPGAVSIVTSTNVYADIARQLAGHIPGAEVTITSLIGDPNTDPHSYEPSTRNELAIARADLIIENGGGYDDFMDLLRRAADGSAGVINAVQVSGHGSANEHVWYDFATVAHIADRITSFLSAHDRADTAAYEQNRSRFMRQLAMLGDLEGRIRGAHAGEQVAITEPVADYLLDACGLVNRTPAAFSDAVEEGTDVSPRVLHETLTLFAHRDVRALVYNAQTSGPQTDAVRKAARTNNIPAVAVTETLPRGETFYSWMHGELVALDAALAERQP